MALEINCFVFFDSLFFVYACFLYYRADFSSMPKFLLLCLKKLLFRSLRLSFGDSIFICCKCWKLWIFLFKVLGLLFLCLSGRFSVCNKADCSWLLETFLRNTVFQFFFAVLANDWIFSTFAPPAPLQKGVAVLE